MNKELFDFIAQCPTPYHAAAHCEELLVKAGYARLYEKDEWDLTPGRGYYVVRGDSSVIAFRLPEDKPAGFMMAAAHSDSPTFVIKENAELCSDYIRLSAEKYGGAIYSTWLDRPLSVAGRICVRTQNGFDTRLCDFGEVCAVIPNVAIHMNREVNTGYSFNPASDMLPLFGGADKKGEFRRRAAEAAGVDEEDVVSWDLMLYNLQPGVEWNGFISAPRLDDLQCAFSALTAFIDAQPSGAIPVCCIFNNEEVGSQTKQGAASTFLRDVLERISVLYGGTGELRRLLAASFLVSCDNGHAVHPNHPEFKDPNHAPLMIAGVVIKHHASQRYHTDAVSAAMFRVICERAGVKTQDYSNRADLPGGGTLGNIANVHVSLNTVDVGLAQLAMHSCFETAGAEDTEQLYKALKAVFSSSIEAVGDGAYAII